MEVNVRFVYSDGEIAKCCECDKDAGYSLSTKEETKHWCSDHSPVMRDPRIISAKFGYGKSDLIDNNKD